MHKRFLAVPAIAAAMSLLLSSPAHASVIWDGDAAQGTATFAALECDAPGSVTVSDDASHGKVFKFNKPLGLKRCEARGMNVGGSEYRFQDNGTYYLGWEGFLNTTDAATVFQWKSVPNNQQNYPVIMKLEQGELRFFHVDVNAEWQRVWTMPYTPNTWYRFAVGIHTSGVATDGWVEIYYNGVQQTLANGSTRYPGRTWDGYNVPKWGSYGAEVTDKRVINWMDSLKVGTTYADVD